MHSLLELISKRRRALRLAYDAIPPRETGVMNFKNAKTCLIVGVRSELTPVDIQRFRDLIPKRVKTDVLLYATSEHPRKPHIGWTVQFSPASFSDHGTIDDVNLLRIFNNSYDILLDISRSTNCYIDYVIQAIPASFKVGPYKKWVNHDMVFKGVVEMEVYADQVECFFAHADD